jgi:outer membrane protein assembly factor BamB
MLYVKYNKFGLRLLSIITIWLLFGVSLISIITPIAVVGDEKINLEIDNNINTSQLNSQSRSTSGLANSAWPMFHQNAQHTGLSPYAGAQVPVLKWTYPIFGSPDPVIDVDGTIYIGGDSLTALKADGSLKWQFRCDKVESPPAIDSNGTVYFGSSGKYPFNGIFYAFYPNGSLKWSFHVGKRIWAGPTIGPDGTIYFGGTETNKTYALNPDGSLKWSYDAGENVLSAPAIGHDGIIYFGGRYNLFALYPNGSLKWRYFTGSHFYSSPAIGLDGTIYVGCGDLLAIYPNGTKKWTHSAYGSITSTPAIDQNGTIYFGSQSYDEGKIYAVNSDGSSKWSYQPGNGVSGSSAAIGSDGMVYIGSRDGYFYVFYPDGSLNWRYNMSGGTGGVVASSPAIASDGTTYVARDLLYAFIGPNESLVANAGPDLNVYLNQKISFDGNLTYYLGNGSLSYNWYYGDGSSSGWQSSSRASHSYNKIGNYTVILNVSDGSLWDTDICMVRVINDSPLANSPWPKFRGNLRNTGLSKYDASSNNGKLKWKYNLGEKVESSPTIGLNGSIYVGSHDYFIWSFNKSGYIKWNVKTGERILSSATLASDGTAYIGSYDTYLYAFNSYGTSQWKFKTNSTIFSSPTIASDGTIYFGSYDKYLYSINPNGTLKWKYKTGDWIKSSPALSADGTIYFGSDDGNVYALHPNGNLIWKYYAGGIVYSAPAIGSDGTIYISSSTSSGSIGYLHALNNNGTKKWNFVTSGTTKSPSIGPDGTIYLASRNQYLYALKPNGTLKWKFKSGDPVSSSPAVDANGTIFIGSNRIDNISKYYLNAINPNGTLKWKFEARDLVFSPAIDSDGTIYFGSWDGHLYAIGGELEEPENRKPIAKITIDPQSYNKLGNLETNRSIYFNGSNSFDPDDDSISYSWDFGDGNKSSEERPVYIFKSPGKFKVSLTVKDHELDSNPTEIQLEIQNASGTSQTPQIVYKVYPTKVYTHEDVHFDATNTTDPDSEYDSLKFKWYFGDNTTSTDDRTTHSYLKPGNYSITLEVTDERDLMAKRSGEIFINVLNRKPIARIKQLKSKNITRGETILLSGADSFDEDGYITGYKWNFDDGIKTNWINKSTIEHNWTETGNHTITLTVMDDQGATDSDVLRIIVVPTGALDSDGDGIPDNLDAFPNDAAASVDTDGDKYPDSWNTGMSEKNSTTGLKLDAYPNDPNRYKVEGSSKDEISREDTFAIILIIIVIVILLVLTSFKILLSRSKRQRSDLIKTESDEELLNKMQYNFLMDEPSVDIEYSRNEISEMLEEKFKSGQVSEETYHLIKSELLLSEETQIDPIIEPTLEGKE